MQMRYVNAGHFPPILMKADKSMRRLNEGSTVIGALEKLPKISEEIVDLEKGQALLCYTDGIGELKNHDDILFEEEILVQFLEKNIEKNASEIASMLNNEIDRFAQKDDFTDDIALLICKLV